MFESTIETMILWRNQDDVIVITKHKSSINDSVLAAEVLDEDLNFNWTTIRSNNDIATSKNIEHLRESIWE